MWPVHPNASIKRAYYDFRRMDFASNMVGVVSQSNHRCFSTVINKIMRIHLRIFPFPSIPVRVMQFLAVQTVHANLVLITRALNP